MPACRFGRLSIPRRAASCRRRIGDAESGGGLAVDITARLEPLLALELRESIPRLRAHHAVRLTNIEALLIELHLNFANLALAEVHGAALRAASALRRRRADRHDRDDPMIVVHDDDVVTHDEVLVAAPFRVDRDQRFGNLDDPHLVRHDRAHAHGEVDVVDSRHVAAAENILTDLGSLFRRQVYRGLLALALLGFALALVPAFLILVLGIALLSLALLSLALTLVPALLVLVLRIALLSLACWASP